MASAAAPAPAPAPPAPLVSSKGAYKLTTNTVLGASRQTLTRHLLTRTLTRHLLFLTSTWHPLTLTLAL